MRNCVYTINIFRHQQKLTQKMSSTMQIDHSVYYILPTHRTGQSPRQTLIAAAP